MATEGWRKEDPSETTMHERVKMPSKEDLSLGIQIVFRSACCQKVSVVLASLSFPLSDSEKNRFPVSLNRVPCPGIRVIRQAKSVFS
jgi:hypothetical protein